MMYEELSWETWRTPSQDLPPPLSPTLCCSPVLTPALKSARHASASGLWLCKFSPICFLSVPVSAKLTPAHSFAISLNYFGTSLILLLWHIFFSAFLLYLLLYITLSPQGATLGRKTYSNNYAHPLYIW